MGVLSYIRVLSIPVLIALYVYSLRQPGPSGLGLTTEADDAVIDKSLVKDKNIVITGTNTGIGKQTAMTLAKFGGNVYMACRNVSACEQVKREISQKTGNKNVHVIQLDLGSLKSIQKFASEFEKLDIPLHTLILNAGLASPCGTTVDGIETNFGVNHIGGFYLTKLLKPSLQKGKSSRVVVVASEGSRMAPILDFTQLRQSCKGGPFEAFALYARSKAANILFAHHLNYLLQKENIGTAYSLHPGAILTDLARSFPFLAELIHKFSDYILKIVPLLKTTSQGSSTTLYTASAPTHLLIPGSYYMDCNPATAPVDFRQAEELWKFSEELIQEKLKK